MKKKCTFSDLEVLDDGCLLLMLLEIFHIRIIYIKINVLFKTYFYGAFKDIILYRLNSIMK